MNEFIICVDEYDNEIGSEEKLEAHISGVLHRAFSIFIFNDKNELLLQKRANNKYHSSSLWTNTCCSHPRKCENINEASRRRLLEEMGIVCELEEIFSFKYFVKFEDGLIENEYDHVLVGTYNKEVNPNKNEVEEFKWLTLKEIKADILLNPNLYTFWFKYIIDNHYEEFKMYL